MRAMAIATAVIVIFSPAPARAAELPVWRIAEMDGLSPSDWAPAAADGDQRYRAARAGRTARLTVPVWWGRGFRPAEGAVYVLKIHYKDTATEPVRLYSHAGVAPYWGLSEVHRIGGSGDGQWKTAEAPVSWDLICRKNAPGDFTEVAIRGNKDLPVESIRVTPAGPDAAESYFRQTRQWIARAQAEKRRIAGRGVRQEPVIPESLRDRALIPYVRSWMFPVEPNSAPQASEAAATLKLRMARNEYEPAAFAVYANAQSLRNVTYTVGPLAGPAGTLRCEPDLHTVEYSAVQETVDYGTMKDSGKYRMYPQRLWPAYPVNIPAGQSHLFWITVRTLGAASEPGTYTGRIHIKGRIGDEPGGARVRAELPIEVQVLPITLLTVEQAGLSLGNCTSGLPTAQEVKTLVEHNHNRMDIWFGGTQPRMTVVDGKLRLDWTYMDDWMARARRYGITQVMWFLGGDPKGFPDTLNLERDLYRAQARTPGQRDDLRREFLRKTNESPDRVIPELRPLYVDFVRQTAEHARAAGWPKLILQPFDEPGKWVHTRPGRNPFHRVIGSGPWIRSHFKDCCSLIRDGCPDMPVALEAHQVEPCLVFLDDVDIFCTNRAWQVPDLAERLRAAGVEFWQYANCDDQAPAHRMRYGFGFYFGGYGSRGALVWAYNFMARFDTSGRGNWGSGWYTPFGTIVTPALVGLREGLDDRRWMETYRAQVAKEDPAGGRLLAEISKEALAQRAQSPYTSYNEAADPKKMDEWRARIIDAMMARRAGK